MRKFLGAIAALLLLLVISGCGQTAAFAPAEGKPQAEVSIIGLNGEEKLAPTAVGIADGCPVLSATLYAAASAKMEVRYTGSGKLAYISSIGGLAEFDNGPLSGWIYVINGDPSNGGKSCGAAILGDGDSVVWYYTTEAGKELGIDPVS